MKHASLIVLANAAWLWAACNSQATTEAFLTIPTDTVFLTFVDTLYLTDTIFVYDTAIVVDTVFCYRKKCRD